MKKLLAFALCLCMLVSSLVVSSLAATIIYDDSFTLGDVNSDGAINAKDALAVKATVAQIDGYECNNNAADIDADGAVTAKDSFYLKGSFVGNINLADYDSDAQIYKFTIGGRDITEFVICVPEGTNHDDNIDFAADVLQNNIRRATKSSFAPSIVEGEVDGPAIVFHDVALNSKQGEELGRDGYIYEVKDGKLNIYGTMRGNMYAVYEILEDYLGFRYYDDDYVFMYKSRTVDIADGTYRFYRPVVAVRNVRAHFGNDEDHALALHINSTDHGSSFNTRKGRYEGSQFINAHSYGYYWQMGTGAQDELLGDASDYNNLEAYYSAMLNIGEVKDEFKWQPCASSEEAYNTMYTGMLMTIARIKNWGSYDFSKESLALDIMSMSFSGNDNEHFCTCQWCKAKAQGTTVKNRAQNLVDAGTWRYGGDFEVVPNGKRCNTTFKKEGYAGVYIDLTNRAAEDVQKLYPGLRIHSILYAHEVPESVRPNQWLNVWYCGFGCNNHYLGSGECTVDGGQLYYTDGQKRNNTVDEPALKAWGQICKDTGARLWFWYYPVTYHYYLADFANLFNIYYDYKYLIEECGVYNMFYEGGGQTYSFEKLKGYLAARMAWNPDITFEEYCDMMKEYLYIYYGDGYEEIYEYILHQEEAGNQSGTCFISNYDRPGDTYSLTYLADHYNEMRALLETALTKADRYEYQERIKNLIAGCDFLGLSAVYKTWYLNGTAEQKALYEERYTWMFNRYTEINVVVFSDADTYHFPKTISYDEDPMTQVYEDGSRLPNSAWGSR